MRIFRDGVTPSAIPLDGIQGVLGYANGRFAWTAAETERFTKAGLQTAMIDVNATAWKLACILDVEQGDAGPAQAPAWIRERETYRPGTATIYAGLDTLPGLFAATAHLPYVYWLLVADWTGKPHIPVVRLPANVRYAGCQYESTENYDETCINAEGWHRP